MKKEQVLALCADVDEKNRVNDSYEAYRRIGKESVFEKLDTEIEVKNQIKKLVDNYEKRLLDKVEKDKKQKELKEGLAAKREKFDSLLRQANECGMSDDDFFSAIEGMLKDKYNEHLRAQIAELEAKIIK